MELIHYSAEPLGPLYSNTSQSEPDNYFQKPNGLWVSVEGVDGWREWCESEGFERARLTVANIIELKPDANLLHLTSAQELDEFTNDYGILGTLAKSHPGLFTSPTIDWDRVAQKYQGIIIAPYQWSRRFAENTSWYYGWDCASGCIWNVDAIQNISSSPVELKEICE
jgi:hypothetical protein